MKRTRKAIARLLAVLAVVAAFIAVFVVVTNGTKDDDKGKGKNHPGKQAKNGKGKSEAKPPAKTPATYTVKPGDTLGAIAAKTGVKVSEMLKLNPTIDAQTLAVGAELKLR